MADENPYRKKFEELGAGHALDSLEDEERAEFKRMWKEASEDDRQLFLQLRSTVHQLAFTVNKDEPSPSVKQQLMAQIRSDSAGSENDPARLSAKGADSEKVQKTEEEGSGSAGFNWQAFAAAASFALLIVCLSLIFYSLNLSSDINRKEAVIVELRSELRQKEEMLSILEAREVDMVLMTGMEINPDGYGKIIWSPQQDRALLQVSNLPPAPGDKDYQLWIIKNNKPVSAGVFSVSNGGDTFFKIERMTATDQQPAFAVTMEPKGGMPQPTGDMYLLGNMDKSRRNK